MGLVSRWASDESVVQKAIHQDSLGGTKTVTPFSEKNDAPVAIVAKEIESLNIEPPKAPKKSMLLDSIWANAPPVENPVKTNREFGSRNSKPLKKSPTLSEKEAKRPTEAPKHRLAQKKPTSPIKTQEVSDDAISVEEWEDESESDMDVSDPGDILYERGPATEAGRSLAMRIGAPPAAKSSTESRSTPKAGQRDVYEAKQSTKQDKERFNAPKQPSKPAKTKYKTPKQKIEEEKLEKLRKKMEEQAAKDAAVQEEVRTMMEKMRDKKLNWADLEDDEW